MHHPTSTIRAMIAIVTLCILCAGRPPASAADVALVSGPGSWAAGEPLVQMYAYGAATLDGKFYVVGGSLGNPFSPNFTTSDLSAYDPAGNSWTGGASMSSSRSAPGVAALSGQIYAVGGLVAPSGGAGSESATVEAYNPATDTWAPKASMSAARIAPGAAALNGKLYVAGGFRISDQQVLATVEEYDPATNTWTPKAAMGAPRAGLGLVALNGKLYAIGGNDSAFRSLATVEEYDPATDTWTPRASMALARNSAGVTVLDGSIYTIGGLLAGAAGTNAVEAYDPASDSWTPKASLLEARGGIGAATVGGKIYVVAGINSRTTFATMEVFTPSAPLTPQSYLPSLSN